MVSETAKTDTDAIDAAVKAQAKLRVVAGIPVILLGLLAVWHLGTPFGASGNRAVAAIAIVHAIYILAAYFLASRVSRTGRTVRARTLVFATAVLDPLMLSNWLMMTGETGALFVCFYLFTILGFGFRIGRLSMWICQAASLLGFTLVLAIAPVWRLHPILGLSFLLILIVVPVYATGLINNLRIARNRAEFESQAKSQLLAKVSHELRTPLSGIMASAELLSSETSDPQTTMRSGLILRLSSDLLLEINDLLDTAKLEAKALTLESAPFDLHVVMEQIRLTFVSMAVAKHIDFHVSVDPAISQMVSGDAHYLARVLKNLVGNALKFTSTGEVEVALTLISAENHIYRILFSVRDTGIGIPAALHKQIFEPFFQASAGTSRQYGGTGLGMSLAQDIVNLMGSDIVVESVPGTGSRFRIEVNLPVAALPCAESTPAAQVRVTKGKRVRVADDNATNLNLIRELLVLDEHDVAMAANGQ
ncbi:MAG: hypothetical protein H7315_22725, partial [Herminiimonas sp.]|nr:hypothetical protein [Herminiimonas sp.]